MSMAEGGIAFPSSLHGHYAQNRHKNGTPSVTLAQVPLPSQPPGVITETKKVKVMEAAEHTLFEGPKESARWVFAPSDVPGAHGQSHVLTHASSHGQIFAHPSDVADSRPQAPIPFVFYHQPDVISNDLAASLSFLTEVIQQPPCLVDTCPTQPAYTGVPFPQDVYPWGDYSYSPAPQGLGHFNHLDSGSPEDYMTTTPHPSVEPTHQPPPFMDISAITTRPQPTRLCSGSTGSHPSTTSPYQTIRSPDKYSDTDADGALDEHGSRRKRQLKSNRKAARKCRQKVKDQEKGLEAREKEFKELNSMLHAQANALKEEVLSLKNKILSHSGCDCALIKQYISSTATEM